MGGVDAQALRVVLPVFDDGFIGCESLQCSESYCEVVGLQNVVQVFSHLLVSVIIVAFERGPLFAFGSCVRPDP